MHVGLPSSLCPSGPATLGERVALRGSVAGVWLATALLVLHPAYRAEGSVWLGRLGLPLWLMWATCLGELVLGLRVALGPARRWLAVAQVGPVLVFTLVLASLDPMLLASPFGVLTKNLPLVSVVLVSTLLVEEGWSARVTWLLRAGMAVVWITEGLVPKILFQQPEELAVVAGSGLVPIDPAVFLHFMGLAQILSGLGALLLRGRWLRLLLWGQVLALLVLPLLVSWQQPLLWVHPFGPLTKNLPILVGTAVLALRLGRPQPRAAS